VAEFIPLEKGKQISAAQLLERFLFPRDMHFQFVSKLSGGEKRRLKLLRILMSNPNFLVLDEPTNDLDIFAMAALEEYLLAFQGSLIVISHDRYFMDKMVDHLFLFEGQGVVKDIIGNYSEYRIQETKLKREQKPEAKAKETAPLQAEVAAKKLSFKEKVEFDKLEKTIETLELEKRQITEKLSSGDLANDVLLDMGVRLGEIVDALEIHSNRWLELSEFA
jgi:ATP-binding cassette subfamily F protein uup